ncbi:MAG: 3-isopropylmalate dehydratase small subunit [Dehalococcoidia bacterium]|nr:3-isopropylmalate dehydratase small subunit [Dehalococcoidia bacterium]MQG15525.1 3-isopropylmalate dehydratase small subunit [SAR202 cluster bacterium]|tara:strand:- start:340 stop:954 length:615 start_codon:yes stop_codon:yes gene_type:complete
MEPFIKHTGLVAPMDRANVDTDQIIPKQFLKRIERTGYGQFLFNDWRFKEDGSLNPEFELNKNRYKGASILAAGSNFGSGSSREHAPWALMDYGFRCIIAPSFADIFYNNCFQNGILPIIAPDNIVVDIINKSRSTSNYKLNVDLKNLKAWDQDEDIVFQFKLDEFRRNSLMNGLDDIGITMQHESDISNFEKTRHKHGGVLRD